MAELSYKLHIKDAENVYECTCYTVKEDAIPTTGNNGIGDAWELKNNDIVCYIGLWRDDATNTPPKKSSDASSLNIITPMSIKKGGVIYHPLRYTLNTFNIKLKATENQEIVFSYYDATNTKQTVNVTSSDVDVVALASTAYTCSITADTGYTKGSISGASSSGVVESNMTISATAATINSYLMTIDVPTGAVINVGGVQYEAGINTVTYDYKTKVAITYAATNGAKYAISDTMANGAAFTSGNTFTMPASACTVTCTSTVRKYTVTIDQAAGTTISVTANDKPVANNDSLVYDTVLTYSVVDSSSTDAYENPTVSAEEAE